MAKNVRQQVADAMTARLANELGAPEAGRGLHYYAWTLGPAICEQLLQASLALADAPGEEAVWTLDGKRRRSTGGIFFVLARYAATRQAAGKAVS